MDSTAMFIMGVIVLLVGIALIIENVKGF